MDSASSRADRLWDANLQPNLDAMRGLLQSEHAVGALRPIAARDVDEHVEAAVDAFLRAYSART